MTVITDSARQGALENLHEEFRKFSDRYKYSVMGGFNPTYMELDSSDKKKAEIDVRTMWMYAANCGIASKDNIPLLKRDDCEFISRVMDATAKVAKNTGMDTKFFAYWLPIDKGFRPAPDLYAHIRTGLHMRGVW